MRSPAHDIAIYLTALGVGTFGGVAAWSINVGAEPETPDEAVTVYDTGGNAPMPDIELRDTTLQVRVRGPVYADAYEKANEIYGFLTQETTREIGEARYIGIWATSDIGAIGRDDNNRFLFTANFRIERQPLDSDEGEG